MQNFVFDIYGTLIDIHTDERSEKFRRKFNARFCRKADVSVDFWKRYEELCSAFAPEEEADFIKIIKRIAEEGGASLPDAEFFRLAMFFRKTSTLNIKAYRGTKKMLKTLKAKGKKLYILSNAQTSFTVPELKKLGLYDFFDGIEISSDFGYKKPSSEFFRYIIKKYGLNPSETVYVGNDISCDVVPSKAAGLNAAYIKSDISPSRDSVEEAAKLADFATDDRKSFNKFLVNL